MKKYITNSLKALLLVPVLALGLGVVTASVVPTSAFAAASTSSCTNDASGGISGGALCAQGDNTETDLFGSSGIFRTITNVLLFLIGAISVIMLIIGGIRYTVSGGDSSAVTSAKNTILYAIVGIIVALLAYAIVNFVLGSFDA